MGATISYSDAFMTYCRYAHKREVAQLQLISYVGSFTLAVDDCGEILRGETLLQ
jgi:hypothetical protein